MHPVASALDLFLQHIDSRIVAILQPIPSLRHEDLHETGPRSIPPDPVAELVRQDIPQLSAIEVGSVEHPIGVLGQPGQRGLRGFAFLIDQLDRVRMLRKPPRAVAPPADLQATFPSGRAGHRRGSWIGLKDVEGGWHFGLMRNALTEGVDHDQGERSPKPSPFSLISSER